MEILKGNLFLSFINKHLKYPKILHLYNFIKKSSKWGLVCLKLSNSSGACAVHTCINCKDAHVFTGCWCWTVIEIVRHPNKMCQTLFNYALLKSPTVRKLGLWSWMIHETFSAECSNKNTLEQFKEPSSDRRKGLSHPDSCPVKGTAWQQNQQKKRNGRIGDDTSLVADVFPFVSVSGLRCPRPPREQWSPVRGRSRQTGLQEEVHFCLSLFSSHTGHVSCLPVPPPPMTLTGSYCIYHAAHQLTS